MSKPRVIKDYDKLDENIIQQIKLKYPSGYEKHLITFKNHKKHLISALPFEAKDRYYLAKMTRAQAQDIITKDEDYNDNGQLRSESKAELEKSVAEFESANLEAVAEPENKK